MVSAATIATETNTAVEAVCTAAGECAPSAVDRMIAFAIAPNTAPVTTAVWVYAGLFIAMGLPAVATATGGITLVQTVTPRATLGR